MAGYGGYFLKGLAGGLQSGVNLARSVSELKWQKKQRKLLEERQTKLTEASNVFGAKVTEFGADNVFSDEETGKLVTLFLAGGYEFQEHHASAMNFIVNMKEKEFNQELEWMGLFAEMIDGFSPSDIPGIYDNFEKTFIKSEKGKKLFEANRLIQEKKKGIGQEVTPYEFYGESPADIKARIAESVAGRMGLDIEFKEPIKTTEAAGISDYNSAVNYLSKFVNAPPETFNKILAGFQKRFPNIDLSAITQESLRGPIPAKGVAVGEEAEVTPEKFRATPLTTLEKYRDSALASNTWADAEAIIDRYTKAGYDPSEMPVKQGWIDAKLEELDSHVEMLREITDENGRLMGDKSFKFMSGDKVESKTGAEWYKDIYEAYMFYLEELRKMGIDVSKYRKIKSPGEVSKVGFLKGMFTGGGVERGYPSIYYTGKVPTPTPTETEIPKLPSL